MQIRKLQQFTREFFRRLCASRREFKLQQSHRYCAKLDVLWPVKLFDEKLEIRNNRGELSQGYQALITAVFASVMR